MSDSPPSGSDRAGARELPASGPATRLRQWASSEPRNLVALLTVPLVVWESVAEIRWHRARGIRAMSPRGVVAYARARPVRFAYSIALSLLPDLVGHVSRRRRHPGRGVPA